MDVRAGIYLVNKRAGETSFSHVRQFTEHVAGRKPRLRVCHAGALDPFAEGLLIILVGPATKLMDLFHPIPKTYVADIAWGAETDNGDLLGKVVATGDVGGLAPQRIEAALREQLGWRDQVPPNTSNKRIDGERAWQKAHRGEEFELPPSRVYLHSIRVLTHALPDCTRVELTCRGGYYVRGLARDVGRALGARGHLRALQRIAIGAYRCPQDIEASSVRAEEWLPWLQRRPLSETDLRLLRSGQVLSGSFSETPPWALPSGFPADELKDLGLGFHQGAAAALLQKAPAGLVRIAWLSPPGP